MTTYLELVDDLKAWLEDDGAEFTAAIPKIVSLGEQRVQRDLDLGIFSVLGTSVATISNPLVTKPVISDAFVFVQVYSDISGARHWFEHRSVDFVTDYLSDATSGTPRYYSEYNETQWLVAPKPSTAYTVSGRAMVRPSRLSPGNPVSWIGNNLSDLLLKACLAEAEGFIKDDPRMAAWKEDYKALLPAAKRDMHALLVERYPLTPMEVPAQPTLAR